MQLRNEAVPLKWSRTAQCGNLSFKQPAGSNISIFCGGCGRCDPLKCQQGQQCCALCLCWWQHCWCLSGWILARGASQGCEQ